MAVYRNTYGRRKFVLGIRIISIMISSLYLTSSCSCMTTGVHHGRHNHHRESTQRKDSKLVPTFHKDPEHQLEKSLLEDTSRRPDIKCDKQEVPSADSPFKNSFQKLVPPTPHYSHCPTCYAHYLNHEKSSDNRNKIDSESIRLEAIKQQILNKLGLKHRPIIRKKLPREVVLQSLFRAEEDNFDLNDEKNKIDHSKNVRTNAKLFESNQLNNNHFLPISGEQLSNGMGSSVPQTSTSYSTNEVQDDFYARTSEIIVFGDAGNKLNNQQLVEFSLSKYSDTGDQELKVKAATLWVKVSFHPLMTHTKKMMVTHKNVTLWVFRVIQENLNNRISSQEFDKYMEMATSLTVSLASLGWQKFDLTSTVRDWYHNVLRPQTTSSESSNHASSTETRDSSKNRYIRSKMSPFFRKEINRLNYESVLYGNYQNNRSKDSVEYDYDDNTVPTSKKLRLLIDCSGCKDLVQIHLFDVRKPKKPKRKPNGKFEIYTYDGYYNDQNATTFDADNRQSNHERNFKNLSSHYFDIQNDNINLNSSATDDPNRPFLVIHTDPNIMKRVRRRALDCSGALKGQCCKQRFYVNFTDLGWSDWILAPQGYYANYCMGSCNSVHRTPDTFLNYYTHVIYEYQKYGDLKGLQPCCAPVKFSSTSLIYFGPDSNIIKRDLPKMTVDECGCP